ncbi:MAG: hypothetical protein LBU25_11050 [Treponema sp.]|nr:hypothetical protein [Treponema sp.]
MAASMKRQGSAKAVWGKRHHGRPPHEYLEGAVLTDRDRREINGAAAVLYCEKYERK